MKTDNSNNESNSNDNNQATKQVPFFARKQAGKPLVIKTSLKAGNGAAEYKCK